jgi:methylated-DNA-[protein]-cysteine S-methyltransferase
MDISYVVFPTALGHAAIAWGERGITRSFLPVDSEPAALSAVRRRLPEAHKAEPPPAVQSAIDGVHALLAGEPRDLSDIALDLSGTDDFHRRVYAIARAIPPGATLTYGEVAARLGDPAAARLVGQAMGANPFPPIVPCHRVVAAGGKLGGFSAPGSVMTKRRLLGIEGALSGGPLFDRLA